MTIFKCYDQPNLLKYVEYFQIQYRMFIFVTLKSYSSIVLLMVRDHKGEDMEKAQI